MVAVLKGEREMVGLLLEEAERQSHPHTHTQGQVGGGGGGGETYTHTHESRETEGERRERIRRWINQQDNNGMTALTHAACGREGKPEIVELLLER